MVGAIFFSCPNFFIFLPFLGKSLIYFMYDDESENTTLGYEPLTCAFKSVEQTKQRFFVWLFFCFCSFITIKEPEAESDFCVLLALIPFHLFPINSPCKASTKEHTLPRSNLTSSWQRRLSQITTAIIVNLFPQKGL